MKDLENIGLFDILSSLLYLTTSNWASGLIPNLSIGNSGEINMGCTIFAIVILAPSDINSVVEFLDDVLIQY